MRKTIVAFAGVAVLAAWGPAMADLCGDKKTGLAKLEAEAPQIRVELAQTEPELETARTENDKWDNLSIGEEGGAVPEWLQTTARFAGMNPRAYIRREHTKWADKLSKLRDKLTDLKRRQTEVGNQIFLLRDIIAGLGCDTPTPAPPVDYGAIDQHTQQYQQSQPGSQTTTSGQSVQPQGSYATPSSGFGPSGSTQPAGQQGQQPGYGHDPSGSPQVPFGPIVEGIQGSMGGKSEKPGMSKPGGG